MAKDSIEDLSVSEAQNEITEEVKIQNEVVDEVKATAPSNKYKIKNIITGKNEMDTIVIEKDGIDVQVSVLKEIAQSIGQEVELDI